MNSYIEKLDVRKIGEYLRQAGKILMANQANSDWRDIITKEENKTRADIMIDNMMRTRLGELTPRIPVFSEERNHKIDERPDLYWLMDPIDGTASWQNDYDGYVTQLALIVNGHPDLGMIYHPCSDRLWFNGSGQKIYCNENVIEVERTQKAGWRLIDNYPTPKGTASKLMEMDEISGYTEKGSLGLKTILTLVGEADIFVKSTIFRDWDLAPAMALAKRSGGFIGNKHGIPLTIGQSIIFNEGLIVSHDQSIANRISEEITTEQIF